MYSSAKITRLDKGKGLVIKIVTPDNITQVTNSMYATAMLTAGIEDAVVEVASPNPSPVIQPWWASTKHMKFLAKRLIQNGRM